MSIDRFDDVNGLDFVFVNDEEQHSLWPAFANVGAGARTVYGKDRRITSRSASSEPRRIWPKSLHDGLVGGPSS